jgi:hypothetical protein
MLIINPFCLLQTGTYVDAAEATIRMKHRRVSSAIMDGTARFDKSPDDLSRKRGPGIYTEEFKQATETVVKKIWEKQPGSSRYAWADEIIRNAAEKAKQFPSRRKYIKSKISSRYLDHTRELTVEEKVQQMQSSWDDEIQQYDNAIQSLEQQLQAKTTALEEEEDKMEQTQRKLHDTHAAHQQLLKEKEALSNAYASLANDNQELTTEGNVLQRSVNRYREQCESLTQSEEQLRTELMQSQSAVQTHRQTIQLLHDQKNDLEVALQAANREVEHVHALIVEAGRNMELKTQEFDALQSKHDNIVEVLNLKCKEAQDKNSIITSQIQNINALENKVSSMSASLGCTENALAEANQRLSARQNEIANLQLQVESLELDASQNTEFVDSLKAQLETSKLEASALVNQVAALKSAQEQLVIANVERFAALTSAHQCEVEQLTSLMQDKAKQLQLLEQGLNNSIMELESLKKHRTDLLEAKVNLTQEVEKYKSELQNNAILIEDLNQKCCFEYNAKTSLQDELQAKIELSDSLQTSLQQVVADLASKCEQLSNVEGQLNALQKEMIYMEEQSSLKHQELQTQFEQEILSMKTNAARELDCLRQTQNQEEKSKSAIHEERIRQLQERHQSEMQSIKQEHLLELDLQLDKARVQFQSQIQQMIDSFEDKVQSSNKQHEAMQLCMKEKDDLNKNMQEELRQSQVRNEDVVQQLNVLREQFFSMQQQYESDRKVWALALQQSEDSALALKNELQNERSLYAHSEHQQQQAFIQDKQAMTEEIDSLRAALQHSKDKEQHAVTELTNSEKSCVSLRKLLADAKISSQHDQDKLRMDVSSQTNLLNAVLKAEQTRCAELKASLGATEAELNSFRRRYGELTQKLDKDRQFFIEGKHQLEEELGKTQKELESQRADMRALRNSTCKDSSISLQQQSQLSSEVNSLQKTVLEQTLQLCVQTQTIQRLEQMCQVNTGPEVERLRCLAVDLEAKMKNLVIEKDELELAKKDLEQLMQTMLKREQEMGSQKANLAGHLNHKQKIHLHEQIKQENMQLQMEKYQLRQDVRHMSAEIRALRQTEISLKQTMNHPFFRPFDVPQASTVSTPTDVISDVSLTSEKITPVVQSSKQTTDEEKITNNMELKNDFNSVINADVQPANVDMIVSDNVHVSDDTLSMSDMHLTNKAAILKQDNLDDAFDIQVEQLCQETDKLAAKNNVPSHSMKIAITESTKPFPVASSVAVSTITPASAIHNTLAPKKRVTRAVGLSINKNNSNVNSNFNNDSTNNSVGSAITKPLATSSVDKQLNLKSKFKMNPNVAVTYTTHAKSHKYADVDDKENSYQATN